MTAYYNEIDPNAAEWLRQLIKVGAIAPGDVDERSIVDVPSIDLKSYTQLHFFAGIGVWSYALRQAGWEDDRPIVTGSCPCQPFSSAGKRKGSSDERDLWWAMFWHICQLRPETIIGEQVASKDGLAWWDTVQADLEGEEYAATAFDLCAAGIGAPHIRQRLFFVAHSRELSRRSEGRGFADGMADPNGSGRERTRQAHPEGRERETVLARRINASDMGDSAGSRCKGSKERGFCTQELCSMLSEGVSDGDLGDPSGMGNPKSLRYEGGSPQDQARKDRGESGRGSVGSSGSFWSDAIWLPCKDGKLRAAKCGTFPLAHGIAPDLVRDGDPCIQTEATAEARGMRIKGYGNAIVASLAIAFIQSAIETLEEL